LSVTAFVLAGPVPHLVCSDPPDSIAAQDLFPVFGYDDFRSLSDSM
jgi:hypothetical protein